jgi:hypothetical protein
MAKHAKTQIILETAREILEDYHPMTVRQVYYQLVSRQVIENNRSQYQAVSNALVDARKDGVIPWQWIEDRTRRPRGVQMWDDLMDFSSRPTGAMCGKHNPPTLKYGKKKTRYPVSSRMYLSLMV